MVARAKKSPFETELSADALSVVWRWLGLDDMNRVAQTARRYRRAARAAQDEWLQGLAQYELAGRRLVSIGIIDAKRLRDMWAAGGWVFELGWRLPLPGKISGDDAPSIARSLGRIARRRGNRREPVDLYLTADSGWRIPIPASVYAAEMERINRKPVLARTADHQRACDRALIQLWCHVDLAIHDVLTEAPIRASTKAASTERAFAAYTAVFLMLTQGVVCADKLKVEHAMYRTYIPALIRAHPEKRRRIYLAFKYLDRFYTRDQKLPQVREMVV
jgi:hypothetical protein